MKNGMRTWIVGGVLLAAGCGRSDDLPDVGEQITKLQSGSEDEQYEGLKNLQFLAGQGNAAIPQLRALLKNKDENLRAEAAKTIGRMGPAASAAVPDLVVMLEEKEMWPRYCAVEALGQMGADALPALAKLQKLLKDPDREVADAAKTAVRKLEKLKKK